MNSLRRSMMAIILSSSVTATAATEATSVSPTPWLNVSGEINFDGTAAKANDYEESLKVDASLRFEVLVHEGIKAVVKARMEHALREAGARPGSQDQELEKMIEEAYISIETDKVSGLPRAIVTVGKHQMAFGQALSKLPMFRDNLLYDLSSEREMIGLTVTLPTNFFNMVDSIAVSLYENGTGDFKVASEKGMSVKLSKKVSDQISAQASALVKESASSASKEARGSVGFVFDAADGSYQIWAEGLVFRNNAELPNADYGAQIGAAKKLGAGTVVVEYSYLQKYSHELAAAYNLPINSWLVISPEIRHRRDLTGFASDDTRVGVQARVQFQKTTGKKLKPKR